VEFEKLALSEKWVCFSDKEVVSMSQSAKSFAGTLPGWFSTIILGVCGYLVVTILTEIKSDIRDIRSEVAQHGRDIAGLKALDEMRAR
jgi:hypothetical protein